MPLNKETKQFIFFFTFKVLKILSAKSCKKAFLLILFFGIIYIQQNLIFLPLDICER